MQHCRKCGRPHDFPGPYCGRCHVQCWPAPGEPLVALNVVPPQDVDAEQMLLGAMMIEEQAIRIAGRIVKASDFYREYHADVLRAIWTGLKSHGQVGPGIVFEILTRKCPGKVGVWGHIEYLLLCCDHCEHASMAEEYARRVKQAAVWRQGVEHAIASIECIYGAMRK